MERYKVILVDDEEEVIEAIVKKVKWKKSLMSWKKRFAGMN